MPLMFEIEYEINLPPLSPPGDFKESWFRLKLMKMVYPWAVTTSWSLIWPMPQIYIILGDLKLSKSGIQFKVV